MVTRHPFIDRDSPIILSPYVTLEQGTGLVHTAPGHGAEDYEIGQKYGLETLAPVDDGGVFTAEAGQFAGQFVFKANRSIVEHLRSIGALAAQRRGEALVSALLAVQEADYFPARWNNGSSRWIIAACARARSMKRRKCSGCPTWGENRIMGTHPTAAGLVHLAPTGMGRAVAVP